MGTGINKPPSTSTTGTATAARWEVNRDSVQVQKDAGGAFFVVRKGDTPSTIAASLKKQGLPIPKELEAFYGKKSTSWKPSDGPHEKILQVGTKFRLPATEQPQGVTYNSWLRGSARPQSALAPAPAREQAPPSGVNLAGPAPAIDQPDLAQVAPKFTALVQADSGTPLSQLQKTLSDELSAVGAGVDRAGVASALDTYLAEHHAQLTSSGNASKDFYAAQLSYVAHAWAGNPDVLKDKTALWETATAAAHKAVPEY